MMMAYFVLLLVLVVLVTNFGIYWHVHIFAWSIIIHMEQKYWHPPPPSPFLIWFKKSLPSKVACILLLPVNTPDLIWKCFSYGHYSQCAAIISLDHIYARSDFPHPFQFCFCKEGMDHAVQNWPGSNLDGLVRVRPNASGLEASRCTGIIGPGFWQDTTIPLPLSPFQTWFCSSSDNIVQNQPKSNLVLAKWIRSRSKPMCKNHPACFWPVWIGCEWDPACLVGC